MGRRSDAKERLIEAVIELLWAGSYGGTSVDQICERAGVKKGSFYHFFESKTELAITGIEHGWQGHRKEMDQIFSPIVPPLERIWKSCENFQREQRDALEKFGHVLGCPIHTLGAEVSTTDERLRDKLQEVMELHIQYYESAVRDAHHQGLIHAPDAEKLARILFAYGEGLLLQARISNDLSHLDDLQAGARRILGVTEET
jgi:TetR/AcrR family transcriptional repressor of nem operon